jgi:uncharacterized repeat protein (TIGR03803 family)
LAITLVAAVVASQPAQAQTFTVLYAFTGGADGGYPYAGLIQDASGDLYGTTEGGGASGYGTVFIVNTIQKEIVLYSFAGPPNDGAYPYGSLVADASGNLYGTTESGGASGNGTVFMLEKTGEETVYHSFAGPPKDGAYPYAGLVRDANGNSYGTTEGGGASRYGTVFTLDPTGKETALYSFPGYPNGAYPFAGLLLGASGALYGTTESGGHHGYGTVFTVAKTGKETVLYKFTGAPKDGVSPYAGLIQDLAGNLYGTTELGGRGYGVLFKLLKTGREKVLYKFTGFPSDGEYPIGGLVQDKSGNFYGTTKGGGANGCGTVFELSTTGTETVLHSFDCSTDGGYPYAGLIIDAAGNLYGTTTSGGPSGAGTVFEITP